MYSWKISKWKKKGVEQHSSFVKGKSVCGGIRIYKSWKDTEETVSGYLFWWWEQKREDGKLEGGTSGCKIINMYF